MKQMLLTTGFVLAVVQSVSGTKARQVIRLDGAWQITDGSDNALPMQFARVVPVPGLADLAQPAFRNPGAVPDEPGNPHVQPVDPLRSWYWYRRTFAIDGPIPAVALLKLHKAKFGTRVYLNGKLVGDHLPNFTPAYFDARPYLNGNGRENELIIRVGASPSSVPTTVPWGFDFEKIRYFSGIYDHVDLILTGTPHVVNVQTAPDVAGRAVRAVVEVANAVDHAALVEIRCTLREWTSRRVVGEKSLQPVRIDAQDKQTFDVTIPITDCRLWSPEDPFLYTLEVSTGSDVYSTRFGMRTFSTDPRTGLFLLNGQPYYLRGSNVCIFRFFEDQARRANPWNEAWVRKLHVRFKQMHWNSLRYCIGFPPEKWYEIADEVGLLIQDEFPIWFLNEWPESLKPNQLAAEYGQWMRERWNHPSVVIWDAQNETVKDKATASAIRAVRHGDLSNRPWDNGWGMPQAPGDVSEAHPYRASRYWLKDRRFSLELFTRETGVPDNGPRKGARPPYLINEYGWLWLNRDGSLPTLTRDLYQDRLGKDSTVDERRLFYARTLAAMTEFWRCRRKCAGVLHFCGLGYSRPEGQTCDNFIDVQKLEYEPHFYKYVRDAFAPVAVVVDFWKEKLPVDAGVVNVPVVVINDLYVPSRCNVTLKLLRNNQSVWNGQYNITIEPLSTQTHRFGVDVPQRPGTYQLVAELQEVGGEVIRSLRNVEVTPERSATPTPDESS